MKTVKEKISVFGAGKMGTGISILFANKGFDVILLAYDDAEAETAKKVIETNMALLIANNIITDEIAEQSKERIRMTTDFDLAAASADIVIECIIEDMNVKQEYFKRLDKACKRDAILCTNTSVMSITEIASKSEHRDRIVGTHFWNPPFLIPLVEVVRTADVTDKAVERICEVLREAGKKPIVVKKDVPGFIANRMQNALGREAVSIVENGIADPKDVDDAVKYSFGMRLGTIGPIEQIDSIGVDLCYNISPYIYKFLENSASPSSVLERKLTENELGFKTGGKGIQNWTEEDMKKYNDRVVNELIRVGKALDRF